MALDLNICDKECLYCVKQYKEKFEFKKGDKFQVRCGGIISKEVRAGFLQHLDPEDRITASTLLDPVAWAARTLDWHCLDHDGSIWRRKNPEYRHYIQYG